MKPGSRDIRHKVLITGDELRVTSESIASMDGTRPRQTDLVISDIWIPWAEQA